MNWNENTRTGTERDRYDGTIIKREQKKKKKMQRSFALLWIIHSRTHLYCCQWHVYFSFNLKNEIPFISSTYFWNLNSLNSVYSKWVYFTSAHCLNVCTLHVQSKYPKKKRKEKKCVYTYISNIYNRNLRPIETDTRRERV